MPLTAAAQTPDGPAPHDPCERTPWRAGTVELCEGVLVYRDYVMDDYGAQGLTPTSQKEKLGSLSNTAGDQRYPDPSKAGTADLVDLAVHLDGDDLVAVFRLNALYDADSTIAALSIDTDDDATTGGGAWPGVDGVSSTGWEHVYTAATGDVAANTITIRVPKPAGDRWRLQAVTAQADGTVMNAAFRGTDEESGTGGSSWWEGKQARVLKSGDISEFGATVDVADLTGDVTEEADHDGPQLGSRVFTSRWTIGSGEGYSYERIYGRHGDTGALCEQEFVSHGRFQPYSVYVPADLPAEPGIQVNLHGCNANHTSQITGDGFQEDFGDELGRVLVAPLGRGPIGYYSDISEADVLEVMADAETTFSPDPDRWFLSGYSMGGYGAMRLAALYPDRWAGMVNWVGFTGDGGNNPTGVNPYEYPSGGIGNVIDFVGNLDSIPSENLYAGADELVQVHTAAALMQRMEAEGVDHRFYLHPAADHLTFALLDEWDKEAAATADRVRVTNPARVIFRTDEELRYPEYGIQHDRAYWVSAIRAAGEGYADVELVNGGCGGEVPVREKANDAGPDPVPWVSNELNTVGGEPAPDGLTGSLANVASLVVDAERTCLAGEDVPYALTTDGPATLTLSDGRVLSFAGAGDHTGVLRADGTVVGTDGSAGGDTTAARTVARTLPSTGADVVLPVLALVTVAGAAVLRRRGRA
ncbi:MAG: hypothetical protein ACLGIG_12760 [Actinomycetes bacterium]